MGAIGAELAGGPVHDNISRSLIHRVCIVEHLTQQIRSKVQRAAHRQRLARHCRSARPVHSRAGRAVSLRPMATDGADMRVALAMCVRL